MQLARQFQTVQIRHIDVHDRKIDGPRAQHRQGFASARHRLDPVAQAREQCLADLSADVVVIGDQDQLVSPMNAGTRLLRGRVRERIRRRDVERNRARKDRADLR